MAAPDPLQFAASARAGFGVVRKGLFRSSGPQLLVSLVLLFVAYPFLEGWSAGPVVASWLFTYVMFSALFAVGGRPRVLVGGLILLLPGIALHWLPHFTAFAPDHPVALASIALFVGFTLWQLLRFVLRAQRVDTEVLCSGISIYLLAGLLWSYLFLVVDRLRPHAFQFPAGDAPDGRLDFANAVYFSFGTLTTAGYGDVTPMDRFARMLATLESIVGVLFLAVLISRLVSLYAQPPATPPDKP